MDLVLVTFRASDLQRPRQGSLAPCGGRSGVFAGASRAASPRVAGASAGLGATLAWATRQASLGRGRATHGPVGALPGEALPGHCGTWGFRKASRGLAGPHGRLAKRRLAKRRLAKRRWDVALPCGSLAGASWGVVGTSRRPRGGRARHRWMVARPHKRLVPDFGPASANAHI